MSFFKELACKRYSCRAFSPKNIDAEIIESILKAAYSAPSACNLKPWHLYVAQGKAMDSLNALRNWYNAPTLLIGTIEPQGSWIRAADNHSYAEFDLALALMQACNEATSHGVHSCFIASFSPEKMASLCSIGPKEKVVVALALGYSQEAVHSMKTISEDDIKGHVTIL